MSKLILVVIYCLLMFIVTRFLEMFGVFDVGFGCSTRYDLESTIEMNTIKVILDQRGVSHRKALDKADLIELLSESGKSKVSLSWLVYFILIHRTWQVHGYQTNCTA